MQHDFGSALSPALLQCQVDRMDAFEMSANRERMLGRQLHRMVRVGYRSRLQFVVVIPQSLLFCIMVEKGRWNFQRHL